MNRSGLSFLLPTMGGKVPVSSVDRLTLRGHPALLVLLTLCPGHQAVFLTDPAQQPDGPRAIILLQTVLSEGRMARSNAAACFLSAPPAPAVQG